MEITLKDIIVLAKELPEECFSEAFERLKQIKEKADKERESQPISCPRCTSVRLVRNGRGHGKQAYICKDCGRSFVGTSTSVMAYSHSGESVWKQVIRDTVDGVSLDKTANSLDLSHMTVFNMRHKILTCVERAVLAVSNPLTGVCEADETYVLESVKGWKIPKDYHRKPRKHGAKASKPGLSDEYICVCTSIDHDNRCTTDSVNRAVPSKADIAKVFGDKVTFDTVMLCDGSNRYDILDDKCTVAHIKRVNKANGFHSFIKKRINNVYHGIATKYLNRYNALFSQVFGKQDSAVEKIYSLIIARDGSFSNIASVKADSLLAI
jgi:transposase-like protein